MQQTGSLVYYLHIILTACIIARNSFWPAKHIQVLKISFEYIKTVKYVMYSEHWLGIGDLMQDSLAHIR